MGATKEGFEEMIKALELKDYPSGFGIVLLSEMNGKKGFEAYGQIILASDWFGME